MFRTARSQRLRVVLSRTRAPASSFSSTASASSSQPNAPLDLDPSFKTLLRDVDLSLARHKADKAARYGNSGPAPLPHRELETLPLEQDSEEYPLATIDTQAEEEYWDPRAARKSPAATFGSHGIGQVTIPFELQDSITRLIEDSNKSTLHSDAKRLFFDQDQSSDQQWDPQYDVKYHSHKQAARHGQRDGTAFASVALPAHYSAIYAVLDHTKRRLGPDWKVERVIDWGTGTGSGLWASAHAFQRPEEVAKRIQGEEPQISHSNIATYLGIDKREGLVSIGKRLLRDIDLGSLSPSWQKSFHDSDRVRRVEGGDTVALSAFMLSSLPTPLARKTMVKEMWESGADVMILMDHNSTAGFEIIAEARQNLLSFGRKEMEDPETEDWEVRGSHVVAPCPHDGACPLYHPGASRLACGFQQRWQRPSFVRLTKHSGLGHEDMGYSYVVIRRGTRPVSRGTQLGRIGDVGRWELEKAAQKHTPKKELLLHNEGEQPASSIEDEFSTSSDGTVAASGSSEDLEEALRLEAFHWPRLVFPPLKNAGHIIIDACTAEGKLMRMTIPKSQGKQPFYDARKSNWGDIFPHAPKNKPQERYQPTRAKRPGGTTATRGADIGKRDSKKEKAMKRASYEGVTKDLKDQRRQARIEKIRRLEDTE